MLTDRVLPLLEGNDSSNADDSWSHSGTRSPMPLLPSRADRVSPPTQLTRSYLALLEVARFLRSKGAKEQS